MQRNPPLLLQKKVFSTRKNFGSNLYYLEFEGWVLPSDFRTRVHELRCFVCTIKHPFKLEKKLSKNGNFSALIETKIRTTLVLIYIRFVYFVISLYSRHWFGAKQASTVETKDNFDVRKPIFIKHFRFIWSIRKQLKINIYLSTQESRQNGWFF